MPTEKNKPGLIINQPVFIDSCRKQKKCSFLATTDNIARCGNPVCYLSMSYLLRYKGEGHHWEDMHFNLQSGCFCFEDMGIFKFCPARTESNSPCKKVISDFAQPDTSVKFYHFLK